IEILLFRFIKHEKVFGRPFWRRRFLTIKRAWSLPSLIIYVVFLVLLLPSSLPPIFWDSIMYHLAYAVDWAHAGRIYADEFLRFPYYANNFVLIYSLMFVLKFGQLCHFATWLCGLLSGLGIYVLVSDDGPRTANIGRFFRVILNVKDSLLPLTLAFSPVFLNYLNVGYVDVPIGLFVLVPVLCTFLILKGESRNYELDLLLTAAFCVGMKITLFLCLPLFLLSLILVLRRQKRKLSHVLAWSAVLVLLGAPWYLRNFVVVGDPIHPVLNFMLQGRDSVFTPGDYLNMKGDLPKLRDASQALMLPIDLFRATNSDSFREPGTNLSVVLLYLPFATLLLVAFRGFRSKAGAGFFYLNLAVIYLLINWLGISLAARYFLHLFPVFLGFLGVGFNVVIHYVSVLAARQRALALALSTLLLLILLALPYPSPTATEFYRTTFRANYLDLPGHLLKKQEFLGLSLPGYRSAQTVMNALSTENGRRQRVLAVGFENLSFYFRERDVVNVGDWFGPGRYIDLMNTVDRSALAEYLSRFDIGAVVVSQSRNQMTREQKQNFVKQLELNHFALQQPVEAGTVIYLKTN
ncbi:MAG TPA: hypothetical protein VMS31_14055, partial [Pyrinomonadaceae bacterium]|nr:hypothetical protein [Pyrinomonadaceae bacterium]